MPLAPIDLPAGTEKLEFDYTAPSFIAAEQIHFRYRLDGYDRGWIEAGATRAAYYTHLPGGIYRFRMQAADRYGRWSHEAEVSIRLRPRFTETIWFKFLA